MAANKYDVLIASMTWAVIEGMTRGEKLRDTMHTVFNLVYNYTRELEKDKS